MDGTEDDLGEQLEQDGRVGGGALDLELLREACDAAPDPSVGGLGGAHLLAVPPHVAAERLPQLEAEPADVAIVGLVLVVLLLLPPPLVAAAGRRLVLPERLGADAELEPVAAPQVAGPVPSQRLEGGEGAAAGLADEVALPGGGHHRAPPPPRALGRRRRRRRVGRVGGGGRVRRRGAQRQRQRHLLLMLLVPRMLHLLAACSQVVCVRVMDGWVEATKKASIWL